MGELNKKLWSDAFKVSLCYFKMFSIGDSEEPSGVDDGFASPARPCEVALLKLRRLCFSLLQIRETHPPLAPCSAWASKE